MTADETGHTAIRDLDLRRLRLFVAVVDAPSLRVAAEQQAISQQSLSVTIRELENQLGVELFSRSRRSLALTDAGRRLYDGALPLLAGGSHLASGVQAVGTGRPDPYMIGHTAELAPSEAFQVIEAAVLQDPGLAIDVMPIAAPTIRDNLLTGRIDLALARRASIPPGLSGAVAMQHELRLAVNSTHPLAHQDSCVMSDLEPYEIVVSSLEDEYTRMVEFYCRRAGFDPTIITSTQRGIPPHTSVVVRPKACALVTNEPGWAHRGQVRILPFENPPFAPVMAIWLPTTSAATRTLILESVGANIDVG
ncbi:LysR family transcriptional regulator [Gordonia sp. NPDC003376]